MEVSCESRRGPTQSLALDVRTVDLSRYDFVDFGCSSGGSIAYCKKRFKADSGIGVDIDSRKVRAALQQGFDVALGDLHSLPGTKAVRFVSMMQFLEHLENVEEVGRVIEKASTLARDFLYIHHPSFDDEHYLLSKGLRLYYHHWSGHRAHVRLSEFHRLFEDLGLLQYHVRPIKPILSSDHPSILPSSAPINQQTYDPNEHGPKPVIDFPYPIFQHIEVFVALRPFEPGEWKALVGESR